MQTQNALELEIVTPAGVVVRESVDEVEAPGVEGHFGVLPGHRPFMSQLRAGELRYRTGKENHFVAVHWGFAEVLPNKVTVLVETAERAEDIDLKDRDGKTVSIKLTKDTKYLVGEVAAPLSDVKLGDRAVVDVAGKEDDLTATQVRLGSHKPPAGADEGKRQHQEGQHGTHEHSEPHK